MKEWYRESKEELLLDLDTNINSGLTKDEVDLRLEKYGPNDLKEEDKKSFLSKVIAQFSDFLILILIGAAVVSFAVGESKDAIVILAIVIVNAFLGIYQEGRAEKALDALKKMSSPNAKVIRNGNLVIVPANTLVPGDVVSLDAGDIIPADLRLVESSNLKN